MALPKIQHVYRLTRDPEAKYNQSGVCICKVGLAASEKYKEQERTLFIDATAFGKTGELIAQSVKKGHRIFVFGKLQTDSWQDYQTGQNRSKISRKLLFW